MGVGLVGLARGATRVSPTKPASKSWFFERSGKFISKMDKKEKLIGVLVIGLILAVLAIVLVLNLNLERAQNTGGAPPGFKATVASTSALLIGTSANQIVATTTNCVSRILTTTGSTIYLTFGNENNQTPVAQGLGHYQATNTQVLYDAATYGCGLWKAIGNVAASATLTEFTSYR